MEPAKLEQEAKLLLKRHGLRGWTFKFDRATKRFGLCNYQTKTVSLSRKLVEANSEETCRDALTHEVAHALAGSLAGHGPGWQRLARELGGRGAACYSPTEVATLEPKWLRWCPRCGLWSTTSRRTRTTCGFCYQATGQEIFLEWKPNPKAGQVRALL